MMGEKWGGGGGGRERKGESGARGGIRQKGGGDRSNEEGKQEEWGREETSWFPPLERYLKNNKPGITTRLLVTNQTTH